MMPLNTAFTISLILGAIFTLLTVIFIMPKSKRTSLSGFFKFIHDLFNFRFLLIERILKLLCTFLTIFVFCLGFFMLFSGYHTAGIFGFGESYVSLAGQGVALMLAGPVVLRIVFEFLMLLVITTRNISEINRKLKSGKCESANSSGSIATENPQTGSGDENSQDIRPDESADGIKHVFCPYCGTKYPKHFLSCPECNGVIADNGGNNEQ